MEGNAVESYVHHERNFASLQAIQFNFLDVYRRARKCSTKRSLANDKFITRFRESQIFRRNSKKAVNRPEILDKTYSFRNIYLPYHITVHS